MNVLSRLVLAGLLIVGWYFTQQPAPAPVPDTPPALNLRGKFQGETAVDDAVAMGGMCAALADKIEWDGSLESPRLTTGAALDDLRRTCREFRMEGVSIGARQPQVRDAIEVFLNEKLGRSGGPIDAEQRSAWVTSLRELATSCRDAVGQ